jgi:hypothetical protein
VCPWGASMLSQRSARHRRSASASSMAFNRFFQHYHKEGRALRTETTINNAHDFYIGTRLHNLPALQLIGFRANRRLLEVEKITHECILAEETFQQINRPRHVASQYASALRCGDPQVQALSSALLVFTWLPDFSNRNIREQFASLLGRTMHELGCGQMTYQLRRLRLHGIIERIPQSHRYRITDFGLRTALLFTRTYARILRRCAARKGPAAVGGQSLCAKNSRPM